MNYLLTLMFDGSPFHGWQRQNNALSVQECVENAVFRLFGEKTAVQGCSRTDAGVHAKDFKANFHIQKQMEERTIVGGLNFYLPDAISVVSCEAVPEDFNARFRCVSKEYHYEFYTGTYTNPFYKNKAAHVKHELNVSLLNEQAKSYIGTHDFSAFCAAGSSVLSNVRTVKNAGVFREGDKIVFSVEADGFLYNMVRIMAGTLLYIDEGKIPPDSIPQILEKKDRTLAGKTMPPEGLYLYKVNY